MKGVNDMSGNNKDMIRVTSPVERLSHWVLAVSCLICLITGLGFMFRTWEVIPSLFGGYYAAKWIHIFSGVIFTMSLINAFFMWRKDCAFEKDDLGWIIQGGGYLWEAKNLPPVYKFNAGQKAFFWFVVVFGAIIAVSGFFMWFSAGLPPVIARLSYMLHALGVFVVASFFIVHLYLGTIGNPGTAQAMFTGYCPRAWCETHCPRWLEDYDKK